MNHLSETLLHPAETARMRGQASEVLDGLLLERDRAERRLAESGRQDLIKFITGRSSIDNAISATRKMIEDIDGWLAEAI